MIECDSWYAVGEILLQEWQGESVIYSGNTGDTHLISGVPVSLLRSFFIKPYSFSNSVDEVMTLFPKLEFTSATGYVRDLLRDLQKKELIEILIE
jgi:hypothetical protein